MSKRTKFLLGIGVIAALVIGWQVAAFAVHDTGKFELDGDATNQAAKAGDDWDNVCRQVTGTNCSTTTGAPDATATEWVAEPNLDSTIFTGGGSKDPIDISSWNWKNGAGGLPAKDNLLHSFAARYTTAQNEQVLFFGSDRWDNSGDATQGFWFFQNPIARNIPNASSGTFSGVHRNGDLLVLTDFSNGGGTSTINVYEWDTSCPSKANNNPQPGQCGDTNLMTRATSNAANCTSAAAGDDFCGIVNSGTITMPWSFVDKSGTTQNRALNGEFFEGGLNLTALGLGDRCFSSVASESRASTSTDATLKDFVLGGFGSCGSSVTTQQQGPASKSIGTGSISVTDNTTVTVTGVTNWTGTVQFSLKQSPNGTPENIGGPVTVSNSTSTVTSPAATVTAAGDYCWSAKFTSGTTGVPDAVDNSGAAECFTVTPVTPQLATTAGPDVNLGSPVTDTATLTGTANKPGTTSGQPDAINPTTPGGPAGGTITFRLFGPSDTGCGPLVFTSNPVAVSGDSAPNSPYGPVSFTPTLPGTYHWVATYSGDPPNTNGTDHNLTCSDANEDVVVKSVPSTMSTAQSFIPNDSATVSATEGGPLAGTVEFKLFESADCSGNAILTQQKAVSGGSPQTVSTTNTTVSTTAANVSWLVSYDSTNDAQRDIPATCLEKTALSINNDGTVSSPPL